MVSALSHCLFNQADLAVPHSCPCCRLLQYAPVAFPWQLLRKPIGLAPQEQADPIRQTAENDCRFCFSFPIQQASYTLSRLKSSASNFCVAQPASYPAATVMTCRRRGASQTAIDAGTLIKWVKGFDNEDAVGKDVYEAAA